MMNVNVKVGKNISLGNDLPLVLIAGPCAIESREHALDTAKELIKITDSLNIPLIYKSSFDKANRSSAKTYRGPGMEKGLKILAEIREVYNMPVITDIHTPEQAKQVAQVVDMLQIPAFLCRQTDLVMAAAATGKPVNIKKGQFVAPEDMNGVMDKAREAGNEDICLCERGTFFGYHNLVVDMRSLLIMKKSGAPVVFDATHSVQLPGGNGICSGGQREFVFPLAKAAISIGVAALFMEVHEYPDHAPCDGPNMIPLRQLPEMLGVFKKIDQLAKYSVEA